MSELTMFHNPSCGTSRNTLALIRQAGIEPQVIEYLKTSPTKDEVRELLPGGKLEPFKKGDGELVVDDGVRRA